MSRVELKALYMMYVAHCVDAASGRARLLRYDEWVEGLAERYDNVADAVNKVLISEH